MMASDDAASWGRLQAEADRPEVREALRRGVRIGAVRVVPGPGGGIRILPGSPGMAEAFLARVLSGARAE